VAKGKATPKVPLIIQSRTYTGESSIEGLVLYLLEKALKYNNPE